jgi:syntaxin 18
MMDITSLFKASIKTVRTRNKALGLNNKPEDPNRIFPRPSKDLSKFQTKAKEIVSNVAKLKEFLTENRKAYLDTSVQLFNQVPKLSQADRAEFDHTTQLIIKTSNQYLQELKRENASQAHANAQTKEHRTIVISIIEQYFKSVCKTYSELKELYSKRQHELNKVTKLEGDGMASFRKSSLGYESPTDSPRVYSSYDDDDKKADEENVNFTVAEVQLFEKENSLLFNELNSLTEEVNQISGRVVKIAELQQVLTEKVLDQEKDIERIATTTVSATENIREGNEQLRQALQSNSGFRIAIIFFILVLFFSILFLDWYND